MTPNVRIPRIIIKFLKKPSRTSDQLYNTIMRTMYTFGLD